MKSKILSLALLLGLLLPLRAFGATGCTYPGTLDSWVDTVAGDFLTVAGLNARSCAIEKLQTGPLRPNDGSAGAPAYAFRTSSTAGFFLSAANQIDISTSSTARWRINSSGHLLAVTDNSFDIGASGATRPRDIYSARDIYAGGVLRVGNTAVTGVTSNSIVLANDKQIQWVNNAGTTAANLSISFTTSDNMKFVVPAVANSYAFFWGGSASLDIVNQNSGAGIKFLGESSADHDPPAANAAIIYAKDNGAGKTTLCARFETGAVQCFATQP